MPIPIPIQFPVRVQCNTAQLLRGLFAKTTADVSDGTKYAPTSACADE